MKLKNFIRVFVCIVLVCTLIFGLSPIKAKAIDPVTITATAVLGVTCIALAAYCGFVLAPPDVDFVEDVGEEFEDFVQVMVSTGGFPDPDDHDDDDLIDSITTDILDTIDSYTDAVLRGSSLIDPAVLGGFIGSEAAFRLFLKWMIQNGFVNRTVDAPLPDGMVFYGNLYLPKIPEIPSDMPYVSVYYANSYYWALYSSSPFTHDSLTENKHYLYPVESLTYQQYRIPKSFSSDWKFYGETSSLPTSAISVQYPDHELFWSNYDVYNKTDSTLLFPAGPNPSDTTEEIESVGPTVYLGPISGAIVDGMQAADIPLPENINLVRLFDGSSEGGLSTVYNNITNITQALADGSMTLKDYQDSITYVEPDVSDPTIPETVPDSTIPPIDIPIDGTLGTTLFADFLSSIGDLIRAPFEWIWEKVETVILPVFRSILDAISGLGTSLQTLGNSIIDKMTEIGTKTIDTIESLVVPDENYLSDKIDALCDQFVFADSIVKTAQQMGVGFAGITTEPPVIYIDLGASQGSYDIGGVVPFLDLRWYATYKPTVDAIISAFLWVCFIWRMFIKLPGIISGVAGDFVLIQSKQEDR